MAFPQKMGNMGKPSSLNLLLVLLVSFFIATTYASPKFKMDPQDGRIQEEDLLPNRSNPILRFMIGA